MFNSAQFPDTTWTLDPKTGKLEKISGNAFQFNDRSITPNQLGNVIVVVPSNGYGPKTLYLKTVDDSYQQMLFHGPPDPVYPAISPDGRYIVFGSEPDGYTPKDNTGIYLVELSKPVPEFGTIAALILIVSVLTVVMFSRFSRLNL